MWYVCLSPSLSNHLKQKMRYLLLSQPLFLFVNLSPRENQVSKQNSNHVITTALFGVYTEKKPTLCVSITRTATKALRRKNRESRQ